MKEEKVSLRKALSYFHKSPKWYYDWKRKIESSDTSDKRGWKSGTPRKLSADLSDTICTIRDQLETESFFWDAEAVLSKLRETYSGDLPSLHYIKKILQRRGKTHGKFSKRKTDERTYPTSLFPDNVLRIGTDFWGPKTVRGCEDKAVAVALSFTGAEKALAPKPDGSTESLVSAEYRFLKENGRIPVWCLSDNGGPMLGNIEYEAKFGRHIRLLLNLGIVPVFVPESQPWRNGATESVNSVWKKKRWGVKTYASVQEVHADMRPFSEALSDRHVKRDKIPQIESHLADNAREKLEKTTTHRSLTGSLHKDALSTIVFIRPVFWDEEEQVAFFKMPGGRIIMDKKWIGTYMVAVVNVRIQKLSIWYESNKERGIFTKIREQNYPCTI